MLLLPAPPLLLLLLMRVVVPGLLRRDGPLRPQLRAQPGCAGRQVRRRRRRRRRRQVLLRWRQVQRRRRRRKRGGAAAAAGRRRQRAEERLVLPRDAQHEVGVEQRAACGGPGEGGRSGAAWRSRQAGRRGAHARTVGTVRASSSLRTAAGAILGPARAGRDDRCARRRAAPRFAAASPPLGADPLPQRPAARAHGRRRRAARAATRPRRSRTCPAASAGRLVLVRSCPRRRAAALAACGPGREAPVHPRSAGAGARAAPLRRRFRCLRAAQHMGGATAGGALQLLRRPGARGDPGPAPKRPRGAPAITPRP
jgi:hypothetical protein